MTIARAKIVDPEFSGFYHCVSRCVRRAFLCGRDAYSNKNYEHRREWITRRIAVLLDCFAIELASYAIMHNHMHTVVRSRPDLVATLTDKQVAERWVSIFASDKSYPDENYEARIAHILSSKDYLLKIRERLSSLSWFFRCLNEYVARKANFEDDCTGRFWEGRFKCQRLDSVASTIAASVYVDLNPIRAKISDRLEKSDYTSIQDRIQVMNGAFKNSSCRPTLLPIRIVTDQLLSEQEYVDLVNEAGLTIIQSRESISKKICDILERLSIKSNKLGMLAQDLCSSFSYFIGPRASMNIFAKKHGLKRLLGSRVATEIFC